MKTSQRNSYSIRFNIEESGNLLYLFSRMINGSPKNGEAYQMANISFAQYVKTDFDYAKNFMIDDVMLGVPCGGRGGRSVRKFQEPSI